MIQNKSSFPTHTKSQSQRWQRNKLCPVTGRWDGCHHRSYIATLNIKRYLLDQKLGSTHHSMTRDPILKLLIPLYPVIPYYTGSTNPLPPFPILYSSQPFIRQWIFCSAIKPPVTHTFVIVIIWIKAKPVYPLRKN